MGVAGYLIVFGPAMAFPGVSLHAATVFAIPGAVIATMGHGFAKRRYETVHDLDTEGNPRDWSRYETE
ncbi:hypothetical protein DY218_14750 [Streptomyces triticagri]|uniref:Uncharacterized protein n=2 Tax=Streptomyces triticagri TaxID=2293568 RepID=A0A372M4U7_9ACTN|nr:hypothetical protein DY218_14750 [Streptomyces triticagri]